MVIQNESKPLDSHSPRPVTTVKSKTVTAPPKVIYYGLPTRLRIPILGVDASVEYLGNTAQGNMAAPKSSTVVGWYKYGAIPGESGSAVIDAHVVGPQGQAGVFAHLNKLHVGDLIQVVDAKNQTISFTVREMHKYGQNEQPSEVFNSSSGAHLNLITCSGEWDRVSKHYLERLVVFADKSS